MSSADSSTPLQSPSQGPASSASSDAVAPLASSNSSSARVPSVERRDDRTVISTRPPLSVAKLPAQGTTQILGSTLVGQRLEYYELAEFVGGGGMGAVFRATDTRLGRTVAVKVLSRDHTDEETIRRFRNEAQNAARLDHPNIARAYYVGEDRGWNYIVFEYIDGINLRDLVERDGPLELEQALYYTLQVAEALAHASSRDIVHRDIKPSNVLVAEDDQVKLVDMGLARLHQMQSGADDLTASGVTLGTFDYISPEQARDPRAADVRSDIYSLGCTLYFMLTGEPPFPDGTALQKLLRHNSDEPPDVRSFRPELPQGVAALIAKMLAKRPSQREQQPAELSAEIISLGRHLSLKKVAEYRHAQPLPIAWRGQWQNKVWQAAAAFALLVVAVVAMEIALSSGRAGSDFLARPQFKPADPELVPELPDAAKASSATTPSEAGTSQALGDFLLHADSLPIPASAAIANSASGTPSPTDESGPTRAENIPANPGEITTGGVTSASVGTNGSLARGKRIIVLGDSPAPPEPGLEYHRDVAEAAARAAELGILEVELAFTGPRIMQPLDLANQRLTIKAAAEHHPVLVFRPELGMGSRQMIRLAGASSANIEFAGLELRLDLPLDPPADGWSLIAMNSGQSLTFHDCILTVKDGNSEQLPIHEQVAMISIQRRRPADTMLMGDAHLAMGQQARVTLERTIARGEANLVSMTDETPLTIRWVQGLLVTSKHLIETGGSSSEPQYYEQIVIDLDRVTSIARQGLYYMRRDAGKAFQFYVNSYADRCIFVADSGTPLFEMVGPSIPPETDELQSTGDGNRFSPIDMPFLFVRQTAGSEPFVARLGRKWSSETRSQAGVPWIQSPPFDRPAHEASKYDFEVDLETAEDAAGCDLLLLPDVFVESAVEPARSSVMNRSSDARPLAR
jgi:eukaryotic-like serine/threonine-protein kinase